MVTEDLRDGDDIFINKNVNSLTSMVIHKLAFVYTFNMPLNMKCLTKTSRELRDGNIDTSALALSAVILLTLLVVILFLDVFGSDKHDE